MLEGGRERETRLHLPSCLVTLNGSEFIENKFVLLTECVVNRRGFYILYV
jgi:hypothetical protein